MDEYRKVIKGMFLIAFFLQNTVGKETEVRAHAGTNVTLPCRVDTNQCGTLHSVKWYRDTSRIYVFSQAGQIARAEGDATERMTVEYNEKGVEALLKISPVEVEDEATYKCEITYLEVRENCDVVQMVKLVTLVKPTSVRMLGTDGVTIKSGTTLDAKNEGTQIEVICEAMGGKPIPTISWYNGTNVIRRASYSAHGDNNGVGTGVSKLHLTLSRGDLFTRFECRVESEALDEPIISWVKADVHLRPTAMNLSGITGHVVQGSNVLLTCDVFGARPAATVRWYNGSLPITDKSLLETVPVDNGDGTFTTKSSLIFKASRWENGKSFNCYGENEVTKSLLEPAMHKLLVLDVRFPPVIRVKAVKSTVKENEKIMLSCTYFANPQKLIGAYWLKDGKNFTYTKGKHTNGNVESPSLHINNISREDMGNYTCWLQNEVGSAQSEESIFLNVLFVPDVEVIMERTIVKAVDRTSIAVMCNVTSGNPSTLSRVKWLLAGREIKVLPDCNNETDVACNINPTLLTLDNITERFAGNYTCQGENLAGIGPESEPQELIVYYPPSPAKLRYYPLRIIKKAFVTLECTVDHPGRPDNVTYIWYRGGHQIHNITVSNWTVQHASLETRSNFTCIALNEGGQSTEATVVINVLAPASFISTLAPYKGVLYSAQNISLTCRIECYPLCSIVWFKDNRPLDTTNNPFYYVNVTNYPADYNKNDFESVESTLIWNMTNWPGQQLNRSAPHSHYTCVSRGNEIGPSVNSTTEIAVDFPPEDLSVSTHIVNVIENDVPASVKCFGKGRPKLSYVWKKNYTSEPLSKTDILQLDKMPRTAAGGYICEAYNKYGSESATVYFNVQYKPECGIAITKKDGNPALLCTVKANPEEVSFTWRIRELNETSIESGEIIKEGRNSYLILDSSVDKSRTYQCVANNSVGFSLPCERHVNAYQEQSSQIGVPGAIPWYVDKEKLIMIVAAIVAIVICVIIICIVIIVLCKRKRENTKYNNPLEMEEREKPDGQSPDTSGQSKWPLKPGVLVHVNKMHHVNISQLSPNSKPFKTTSVSSTLSKYKRNKSKVYARLQRLKDFLGYSHNHIPSGIRESASGVVTYKKFNSSTPKSEPVVNTRKRKKPGYSPNPSSTGDKMRLGAVPPVGGLADPSNDPDKGFYENLPFHGMQNPPNKPISVIAPFTQGNNHNFNASTKSLLPTSVTNSQSTLMPFGSKTVQRHQSFHGFQQKPIDSISTIYNLNKNFSNPYLYQLQHFSKLCNSNLYLNRNPMTCSTNCVGNLKENWNYPLFNSQFNQNYPNNFQPLLNFNPLIAPNPFSFPPQRNRITGRREVVDIRRTASGINISENKQKPTTIPPSKLPEKVVNKRFGSLELKKHKCYSPTFYSMRCKKHGKKRPVVYALPKKMFNEITSAPKNDEENRDCVKVNSEEIFENLTDSIQILEQDLNNQEIVPIPAPRCKKHDTIYENVSKNIIETAKCDTLENNSNSSNDSSENIESEISVTQAQVHSTVNDEEDNKESLKKELNRNNLIENRTLHSVPVKPNDNQCDKQFSPKLVGVSPKKNIIKNSPTIKVSPNFVKPKTESPKGALSLQIQAKRKTLPNDENLPFIPQMPLLDTQKRWSNNPTNNLSSQNAFYTLTTPHYKHLNTGLPQQYSATIPHQKHTKLIPRALFQEQLPKSKSFSSKSKHKKHFQIPLQKCHSFKFQTAESYFQPIKNIHEENLIRNGYVSDYPESSHHGRHNKREKLKQKTKGPLVLRRPSDYQENVQFQEYMQNSVQLQYPQPMLGRSLDNNSATNKPNGVVYADLDMPKTNKKSNSHETNSSQSKLQKSKAKTEYATLSFNDVGQEIDV